MYQETPLEKRITTPVHEAPGAKVVPTTDQSSHDLRGNIEKTRGKMDSTIEQLGEKLNPKHLSNEIGAWWEQTLDSQALERWKDRGADVVDHVERHPIPYALVGLGLGLSVYASLKDHSELRRQARDIQRATGSAYRSAAGSVKGATERAGESVKSGYAQVSSRAGEVGDSALEAARHGRAAFRRTADEQPLAVGLGFAAAGLLAGLLLPRSDVEDRLVGERAAAVKSQAKDAGKDMLERGRDALHDTVESASELAREHGLTPEAAKQKGKEIAKAAAKPGASHSPNAENSTKEGSSARA